MAARKPRVGLLGLMLELYDKTHPQLRKMQTKFARKLIGALGEVADVSFPGICNTRAAVDKAVAGFEADDDKYAVAHVNGTDWDDGGTYQTRADLDEPNGFWMALQFDGDGDPNHSYLRSAAWNGDKFDWDGAWDIEHHIFTSWDPNEPGLSYWSSGLCGVAVVVSQWSTPTGFSDAKFDGIEVRWGTFTNVFRTLTLKKKDCTIVLEPNLPDPAGGDLRRYTNGTVLCLQAEPVGNKTFNKWVIKGPNQVGDPAYQEINDTNIVLCLTMDGDYWVKGVCKCGGGGVEPFAAVVLLTLGLGVLLRRIQ